LKNRSGFNLVRKTRKKSNSGSIFVKEKCVEKFLEWWSESDELKAILQLVIPQVDNALKLINIEEITNSRKLSELLYDLVGSNFLYEIHGDPDRDKTQKFRKLILDACIKNQEYTKDQIISIAQNSHWQLKDHTSLEQIVRSNAKDWLLQLAKYSQLDPSTSHPPQENSDAFLETEEIHANIDYKPLYDYQYTAGLRIRQILENNPDEKRMLLSIPTGSGKTRLMVEALIDWLNYGKENSPSQQKDSKFIIWIAQSHELCEQAIDAFKSLYKIRGKSSLTIHRFFGKGGAPPPMDLSDFLNGNGIIVATIQSFHKLIPKNEHASTDDIDEEGEIDVEFESDNPLLKLSELTSCIVIDEAHRATSKMYTRFLAGMGFNFRKKEPNSKNIGLFGLTATPFRGTGVDFESGGSELTKQTITLRNRFGGEPYYPQIYADIHEKRHKPVPIIDSPNVAHTEESTRISGDRSFDNEGVLVTYSWQITYLPSASELYSTSEEPLPNPKQEKIIDYEFPKSGTYKIQLTIKNNEGIENQTEQFIDVKIPDTTDINKELDNQKLLYRRLITRKILCEVFHEKIKLKETRLNRDESEKYIAKGEYHKQTLDERGKNFSRNNLILEIIQKLREFKRKKILIFACNIDHARLLTIVLKAKYGINAEYLDSKVNMGRRIEIIEKFKQDTDDINVLCNVDILTTGFDAPNIDCVFVTRPAKSTVLYTQMIGRGMRGTRGGGTPDMWLIDIDDNFQLHYDFDSEAKLGWKMFEDEWKSLSELDIQLVEGDVDGFQKINPHLSQDTPKIPTDTKFDKWKKEREQIELEQKILSKEVEEELPDDETEQPLEWPCIDCGVTAIGIPEIQKFFGIEGDPKLLISHITNNDYQDLPSRCYNCRMASVIPEVSTIEPEVSTIEPEVSTIEPEVSTIEPEVSTIEPEVSTIEPEVSTIEPEVIPEQISCPYVEFMENQQNIHGNYQMVLGLFLIESQKQGYDKFDIDEARLYLQKYNPGKTLSELPRNHAVFDVYRKRGFFTDYSEEPEKTSYGKRGFYSESFSFGETKFKEILEPEIFKELCIKKIEEYEEKSKMEIENEPVSPSSDEDLELSHQLDTHYKNLKKQLGHIPTTRQFRELTPDNLSQIMVKIYYHKVAESKKDFPISKLVEDIEGGPDYFAHSFDGLRDSKNDFAGDDHNLRDNLYDEYFELYHSVKREITKEELDEYGNYTIEDYDEVFDDDVDVMFKETTHVMKNIEINFSDDRFQETIEKINIDYHELKKTLGHAPHFEEYREKSKIGIEYILNFYGSLGRFKRISDRKQNDQHTILHLEKEFHKIKELLNMPPLFTQMLKHCREGFRILDIFGSYTEYLKWLKEPDNKESIVDENFKNQRRIELIQQSLKRIDDVGRDRTIQLLLEDPEIPYNEWFGSKTSFIDVLDVEKHDPWIKSTFEKIRHIQKPVSTNEKMKFLRSNHISKFKKQIKGIQKNIQTAQKPTSCPKCHSKLENLGQAVVCSSKYCTYYKSG
jgi:superfamily II DNA or RNA helicase